MSRSSAVGLRNTPRIAGVIAVLAGLLVLPACWVTSINPLYEQGGAGKDPDLVFDQSLIGSWSKSDDKCTTLLMISAKDQVYDLQSTQQGEGCGDEKTHYQARLVRLDTHYFLDLSPIAADVCDMCLARHDIFLSKFDKTTLSFTPIDSDWLKKSLASKTVTLATVTGDTDTITASTKDLKRFCRKYAADKAVFKPDSADVFERNPAPAASGPG